MKTRAQYNGWVDIVLVPVARLSAVLGQLNDPANPVIGNVRSVAINFVAQCIKAAKENDNAILQTDVDNLYQETLVKISSSATRGIFQQALGSLKIVSSQALEKKPISRIAAHLDTSLEDSEWADASFISGDVLKAALAKFQSKDGPLNGELQKVAVGLFENCIQRMGGDTSLLKCDVAELYNIEREKLRPDLKKIIFDKAIEGLGITVTRSLLR